MKKYFPIIMIFILFFTGCATYTPIRELPEAEKEKITTRIYNYDYETVFSAIISVCYDSDKLIDKMDKEIGLITTEWETESASDAAIRKAVIGLGQQRAKWNFRVIKLDDNNTKVKATFYREVQSTFGWEKIEPTNHEVYIKLYQDAFNKFEKYCKEGTL